jgi:2,5-diketo-D-gluconate reductase A
LETAHLKTECQTVASAIAIRRVVSKPKLLLRWGMQRGYAVLTKSSNHEIIQANLDLFDFEISDDDMKAIDALDKGEHVAWAATGVNPQAI